MNTKVYSQAHSGHDIYICFLVGAFTGLISLLFQSFCVAVFLSSLPRFDVFSARFFKFPETPAHWEAFQLCVPPTHPPTHPFIHPSIHPSIHTCSPALLYIYIYSSAVNTNQDGARFRPWPAGSILPHCTHEPTYGRQTPLWSFWAFWSWS